MVKKIGYIKIDNIKNEEKNVTSANEIVKLSKYYWLLNIGKIENFLVNTKISKIDLTG